MWSKYNRSAAQLPREVAPKAPIAWVFCPSVDVFIMYTRLGGPAPKGDVSRCLLRDQACRESVRCKSVF